MRSTSSRLTARTCGVTHWKCKATLASVLAKAGLGLRFNKHMEHDDGETVFSLARKLGLEGIVSKAERLALPLGSLAGLVEDEVNG
jgi:hypothetical protein